jgi:hypothetical protein
MEAVGAVAGVSDELDEPGWDDCANAVPWETELVPRSKAAAAIGRYRDRKGRFTQNTIRIRRSRRV